MSRPIADFTPSLAGPMAAPPPCVNRSFVDRNGAWILSLCLHVMVFSLLVMNKPQHPLADLLSDPAIHVSLVDEPPAGDPAGDPAGLALAGGVAGGAIAVQPAGAANASAPAPVTEVAPAAPVGDGLPAATESGAQTTEAATRLDARIPDTPALEQPEPAPMATPATGPPVSPAANSLADSSGLLDPLDPDDPLNDEKNDQLADALSPEQRLGLVKLPEAGPPAGAGATGGGQAGAQASGGGKAGAAGHALAEGVYAASAAQGEKGSAVVAERISAAQVKAKAKEIFLGNRKRDLFVDKGALEGVRRDLILTDAPQDEAQIVLARYGIKILTQQMSGLRGGGGGASFLSSALTKQGRFVNKMGNGLLVFTFGPPAVARMAQLEEDALRQKGFEPTKARVVKVVFGIVSTTSGYDLGVKEVEIEPIAPTPTPTPAPERAKG